MEPYDPFEDLTKRELETLEWVLEASLTHEPIEDQADVRRSVLSRVRTILEDRNAEKIPEAS